MKNEFVITNKASLSLIKKLKEIYKKGYLPSRGNESYFKYVDDDALVRSGELANCFEHACFNLTNDQFLENDITFSEAYSFFGKYAGLIDMGNNEKSAEQMEKALVAIVKEVGLKMRRSSLTSIVKPNEWKVALYFAKDTTYETGYDYHFFLQEKNGSWSCKVGWTNSYQTWTALPKSFAVDNLQYTKKSIWTITNPYVKIDNEDSLEK